MVRAGRDEEGLTRYLAEIHKIPKLDRKGEMQLAKRWARKKDRAAADALVRAHLRDVAAIASHYRGYGLKLGDLIEEGNVGLMEAVRRFDPSRNLRFMTYAAYWIRAYILAYVLKHWSIVGVGTGPLQSKMFFRLHRERSKLATQLGSGDGSINGSLAEKFGTSESRIETMTQRLERRDASLDAQLYHDGEATMLDTLAADGPDLEEQAAEAERDERVRAVLERVRATLDERERKIVDERLLAGTDGATLADLGKQMGLSRERVRQLEERLKRKLRLALADLSDDRIAAEPLRAAA